MEWSEKVTAALEGLLSFAQAKGLVDPLDRRFAGICCWMSWGWTRLRMCPPLKRKSLKQPLHCCAVYATLPWKKA